MKLTGAVNAVEREEIPRSPSPQWSLSFKKKCRARNLIKCDGNHVILQCEKLRGMKLAERREVVEKSGLCTFRLRHAAELECYAKGGLSKPKCTRPGCDGEHVSGLHALMGEADAEVNLVAGDEGEAVSEYEGEYESEYDYQYRWECEGLWVGTLEATEVPKETDESAGTIAGQESALCDGSVREGEEMDQYECGYESLWVGTIGATEVSEDAAITVGRGPAQDEDPAGMEEETSGDEQWDLETGQSNGRADGSRGPLHESSHRFRGDRARPPRPTETDQPRLKARPRAASDQQWEEARYSAWLRQLLSDDSSDEDGDEERYGRFAESGKWMTELYGIPQYSTATSGRECSA
jgi:hypothetical protein